MKYLVYIPLCFLLSDFHAAGQPFWDSPKPKFREIDSVRNLLDLSRRDTITAGNLAELATLYSYSSYDSAMFYSRQTFELSRQIGYVRGKLAALTIMGFAEEILKRNWDSAVVYYQEAIRLATDNRMNNELERLYGIIHNAYVYQGNFPRAMEIASEGLAYARKSGDRLRELHYTNLIAAAYFRQDLYDRSLEEYRKALQLAESMPPGDLSGLNLVSLADIFYGMGEVYTATGDTVSAQEYLEKALHGFTVLRRHPQFLRSYMVPNTLFRMGVTKRRSGNYEEALRYAQAAVDSIQTIPCNQYEIAGYYLLAGDVMRLLGRFDEARISLVKGLQIAQSIRHAENARDAYRSLALLYADENRYDSAWYYNERYAVLKDSISNERTRIRTREIKAVYDLAQRDREIARQRNQWNILVTAFIVLLLTMGFLYNRYRLRQRNRYQRELNRQQNELFNAISLAQEQERKRIAQDIHDSLGSVLSAAKLKMAEIRDMKPELNTSDKFLSVSNLLDEASAELRSISHNIMPATLSKLGLAAAIRNLAEKISSNKGVEIRFIAYAFDERLDEKTEISIYRIVLELINNVVKHAAATKATVQLIRFPDHINITVEDNGKGFMPDKVAEEKKGIGLGSVESRVEYLRGTMDIDSLPGKGTTVVVDIPLQR